MLELLTLFKPFTWKHFAYWSFEMHKQLVCPPAALDFSGLGIGFKIQIIFYLPYFSPQWKAVTYGMGCWSFVTTHIGINYQFPQSRATFLAKWTHKWLPTLSLFCLLILKQQAPSLPHRPPAKQNRIGYSWFKFVQLYIYVVFLIKNAYMYLLTSVG